MDDLYPEGELPGRLRAIRKSCDLALIAWADNDKGNFVEQLENLRSQTSALIAKIPADWWKHA
jgi:hypothetical protein